MAGPSTEPDLARSLMHASALAFLAERRGRWGALVAASLRSSAQASLARGTPTDLLRERIAAAREFLDERA